MNSYSVDELGIIFFAGVIMVIILSFIGLMNKWEKESDKENKLDDNYEANKKP